MLVRNAEVIDKVHPMGNNTVQDQDNSIEENVHVDIDEGSVVPTRRLVIQDGHHGIGNCIGIGVGERAVVVASLLVVVGDRRDGVGSGIGIGVGEVPLCLTCLAVVTGVA